MRAASLVLSGLLLFGFATTLPADHHEDALMLEVTALGDALSKAITENDVDFMFGMYAENAISLPNYGPRLQGIDAFKQHHDQMMAAGMKINSFESEPTEVWQAGDQVIEIGNYEISLDMPGMPGIVDKGKYLTIYVRDAEGKLKIKVETWNTDMNPMMMGGHEPEGGEMHEGHEGG